MLAMSRTRMATLAALGVALALGARLVAAATKRAAPPAEVRLSAQTPPPPFNTGAKSSFRVLATGSIRLAAGARIEVGAQVSGTVHSLSVTQGSRVEAGQIIAQLDTREAHALLDQAAAQVQELTAAEQQAADQARRVAALGAAKVATQQDLVAVEAAAAQARARLDAARSAEELARIRLGYATVRAPIAGIVASVTTHEGETVAASLAAPTFVTLIDPTRLECVALVDETDIGRVALGDSAEFTVDAYPGRVYHGIVARIAPDATVVGGVVDYETTLRLIGSTAGLKPQMTTSVTITRRSSN